MEKNTSKFSEDFINSYVKNSGKGYILELDVEYPKKLHDLHSDLPFLPERMKINKCSKLVCNMFDKNNYIINSLQITTTFHINAYLGLLFKCLDGSDILSMSECSSHRISTFRFVSPI